MKLFRYYKNDLVSLILLILFIAGGIRGVFIDGYWLAGLLFIAALNNVFMVRERGLFMDKVLYYLDDYPDLMIKLGLHKFSVKSKRSIFEWIVLGLIFAGSLFVITMAVYTIITSAI